MSDHPAAFFDAISAGDAAAIRKAMAGKEFLLLGMTDQSDGEEDSGPLTAEIDGSDALVVFTSEELAREFVQEQEELFEETDELEGLVVEGEALLEYLPEGFAMLIDPECDEAALIDPELANEIAAQPG